MTPTWQSFFGPLRTGTNGIDIAASITQYSVRSSSITRFMRQIWGVRQKPHQQPRLSQRGASLNREAPAGLTPRLPGIADATDTEVA